MKWTLPAALAAMLVLPAVAMAGGRHDDGHSRSSWGVSIGLGFGGHSHGHYRDYGVTTRYYYGSPGYYYRPAPVYVAPPVYYAPPVVYSPPPVYYAPPVYYSSPPCYYYQSSPSVGFYYRETRYSH